MLSMAASIHSFNVCLTCGRNFSRSAKLKPVWLCSLLIEIFIYLLFLLDSLGNADGARGADQAAEVTADTLGDNDAGLTVGCVEDDGLMAAVHTRDVATSATDAPLAVNLRKDDGLAVEVGGGDEVRQLLADTGIERGQTPLREIVLQAEREVVDDAVAVLHDGGAHLHVATAQLDELQRVAPRLDTADAAQFHLLAVRAIEKGILCHLQDVAQGDGLDRTTRQPLNGFATADLGTVAHRHRLDGVDGQNGISTCEVGGRGRLVDLRDVGRHFGDDGNGDVALDVGRIEQHPLGVLPHVAAHARQSHLRTR